LNFKYSLTVSQFNYPYFCQSNKNVNQQLMKYPLLTILFLNIFLRLNAQSISITPQVVNAGVSPDSFEIRAKATFKNTSTQTKKFIWKRTILNMTNGWSSLVCDSKGCWASSINDAPEQIELPANGTSNIDVYIRPDKKMGAATIEVKVFEVGNEANAVTGRYLFSSTTRSREVKEYAQSSLRVYPNPTTEYFMITENEIVEKAVVYNIIGRQIRSFPVVDGQRYYISDLPDGFYIIRLLNNNGGTIKTVRLSKSRAKA
jgi:hypothetical protein